MERECRTLGGMQVLGLIAGNGRYPFETVAGARRGGVERVVLAAFEGETRPELAEAVDEIAWFRVGQLGKMIRYFRSAGVENAVMAGQIAPRNLFDLRPDMRTLLMLGRLRTRQAETIFAAIADELGKDGITLLPATTFMEDSLAAEGVVGGPGLRRRDREDARRALRVAAEVAALDIGQSLVIRQGTVLAVEAFEGTNECMKRGGGLGKGKALLIKVSKPGQDFRFDVPVVGAETVRTAAACGIVGMMVEAGRTLILEREEVAALCQSHAITIEAAAVPPAAGNSKTTT